MVVDVVKKRLYEKDDLQELIEQKPLALAQK